MRNVTSILHYTELENNLDGSLKMTVMKKVEFRSLKPFGKFKLSTAKHPKKLPNIIPYDEVSVSWKEAVTLTPEQDKEVMRMMKKAKTDILCENDGYLSFYTRTPQGFCHVSHPKLVQYREDDGFRAMVNGGDSFAGVMLNNMK